MNSIVVEVEGNRYMVQMEPTFSVEFISKKRHYWNKLKALLFSKKTPPVSRDYIVKDDNEFFTRLTN